MFSRIVNHLGSGQFGTVSKGKWEVSGRTVDVAVKMLKAGSAQEDKVKFLQEAAIMGQFAHPNVVQLYGVVTSGNTVSTYIAVIGFCAPLGLECNTINLHTVDDSARAAGQGRPQEVLDIIATKVNSESLTVIKLC